jgi:hypothetical protein
MAEEGGRPSPLSVENMAVQCLFQRSFEGNLQSMSRIYVRNVAVASPPQLRRRWQSISKILLRKLAVHAKDLCKEGGRPSPLIKKKMAVHVKDLYMEGGIPGPSRKKKMAVHVKDLCKEGGSG